MKNTIPKPYFFWKGTPITFMDGESIAIALARSQISEFGATNSGQVKSIFCGIGQCQGCTVYVKGIGNTEACLMPGQQDLDVEPCQLLPFTQGSTNES